MPNFLRLFPLNIVVFPGERLNLHIFEPRYKQMISECLESGESFGIVPVLDEMKDTGTELKVLQLVKTHDDGSMDITCQGLKVFKLKEFFPASAGKLYPAGMVEWLPDNSSEDQTVRTKILDIFAQLMSMLSEGKDPLKENAQLSHKLGHHIAMNTAKEYELLCLPTESERQIFILQHLNGLLPILLEIENLRERIKRNGYFQALSTPS